MTESNEEYNSANAKDVAKAKRTQHNDKQTEIKDLRATMSTASGRRFMWNLLSRCGLYRFGYNPDNNRLQFDSGAKNIGGYYVAILTEHCNTEYLLMQKEQEALKLKRGKEK